MTLGQVTSADAELEHLYYVSVDRRGNKAVDGYYDPILWDMIYAKTTNENKEAMDKLAPFHGVGIRCNCGSIYETPVDGPLDFKVQ